MGRVKNAPAFRVGDWVSFLYGARQVRAQVIEDRGPLGVNRRRLYRVRLDQEAEEPLMFEMPEDVLEPTAAPNTPAAPDKAAVLGYLKRGGLVAILRANLDGGRDQPRVWLTQDAQGVVAHTFVADCGLIGGRKVPFFALHDGKIFAGKKDEVLAFLTSFGLTPGEAEDVIRMVGASP